MNRNKIDRHNKTLMDPHFTGSFTLSEREGDVTIKSMLQNQVAKNFVW